MDGTECRNGRNKSYEIYPQIQGPVAFQSPKGACGNLQIESLPDLMIFFLAIPLNTSHTLACPTDLPVLQKIVYLCIFPIFELIPRYQLSKLVRV